MFEVADMIKGTEHRAWKKDIAYPSAFADSFQKLDVDSVPMEIFAELNTTVQAEWFASVAANCKGQKLPLAMFKFISEMHRYGKALVEVQPKRQMVDLNEVALSAMVTSFSAKKDEYVVLEEQIKQLERSGAAEKEVVIRQKLDIGHALPSSDMMIEESKSIEKRKEALEQELAKLNR